MFIHSIFEFDFIISFHVVRDVSFTGCSFDAPFLARASALSFPLISQWLGIHWRVISCLNSFMKRSIGREFLYDIGAISFTVQGL